jgi:membrane protein
MLAVVVSVVTSFLKTEGEQEIDQFISRFVATMVPQGAASTNVLDEAPVDAASPTAHTRTSALTNTQAAVPAQSLAPSAQHKQAVQLSAEATTSIHNYIQQARSKAIGLTGSIALILTAISMLSQIETMFNDIWGVARGRSRFTQVILYWGVISLAPLLLAVVAGLASGPHLNWTKRLLDFSPLMGKVVFRVMPIVLVCMGFAVFYALMPNTKVHWDAAVVGGAVGGLLWHLNGAVSVLFVSRVVSNFNIYGSLGLVPIFMIGLYLSWWIVLFGAQVSYAFQNRATYLEERQVENIDQRTRELIALRLMARIGLRFVQGQSPLTVAEMGEQMGVPTRLIEQVLQNLNSCGLASPTAGRESGWLPARPLESISCNDVLRAMRCARGEQLAMRDEPARGEVYAQFLLIEQVTEQAAACVNMRELVKRMQARAGKAASQHPSGVEVRAQGREHTLSE